jgi:recombination protein RecT
MADNALVILEQQLQPLAPRFADVLPKSLPVERLMRTVMISVERLPKLLECDRQSLFNAAMSAACLGLEVDGVTGQAYLIPFKGKAQLVIGYKGMNTIAARSGITITGAVVREGDAFEYDKGEGWITHKPKLGGERQRRIVAAWAKAAVTGRPPIIEVLSIDELNAVKAKSPGAQRSDSPWNDPSIGFPAMCEKTAKRRLARSLPLNVMQYAARLDEAVDEQGEPAWISPDKGVVIEGEIIAPRRTNHTPTTEELTSSAPTREPAPDHAAAPEAGEPGAAATGLSLEDEAREAAKRGEAVFNVFWKRINRDERATLQDLGEELRGLMKDAEAT